MPWLVADSFTLTISLSLFMNEDPRLHLPSASSFHLDVACNGRQNLLRKMREDKKPFAKDDEEFTEYQARGQRIHHARRTTMTIDLSAEELDAFHKLCAYENRLFEDWTVGFEEKPEAVNSDRLWLNDASTLEPILSGEVDVIYLAGYRGLIPDFKTGAAYYVGAARSSWQLRIYALLAWKEWPQLTNIRVAFVKPEAFGPKLDYADLTVPQLETIDRAVLDTIWKTKQPDAQLHAGPHCRWCPARAVCEEAARYSMLPVALTSDGEALSKEYIQDIVRLMPIESAAAVWRKRGEITAIMDAVTARLKALPAAELDKVGLALKDGRKNDFVLDKVGAFNALRALGYSSSDILACVKYGKGEVVKMIQKEKNISKAKAEELYEADLGKFIKRDTTAPSLQEK